MRSLIARLIATRKARQGSSCRGALASQFLPEEEKEELGLLSPAVREKLTREGLKKCRNSSPCRG